MRHRRRLRRRAEQSWILRVRQGPPDWSGSRLDWRTRARRLARRSGAVSRVLPAISGWQSPDDGAQSAAGMHRPDRICRPREPANGHRQSQVRPGRGRSRGSLHAVARAMHAEYAAIVDAGLIVQIDDPWLTALYHEDPYQLGPEAHIEMLNFALDGIPPERVRYHTCYGINEGPRIHDIPLRDLLPMLLRVRAGAISVEAANPRLLHEWHVWEEHRLPEDKLLIPGMISHAYNIVEHPELIADMLVAYARLVGRERVIAGADCGFSSSATFSPEVDPKVVWAKFQALAEGARLASQRLQRASGHNMA